MHIFSTITSLIHPLTPDLSERSSNVVCAEAAYCQTKSNIGCLASYTPPQSHTTSFYPPDPIDKGFYNTEGYLMERSISSNRQSLLRGHYVSQIIASQNPQTRTFQNEIMSCLISIVLLQLLTSLIDLLIGITEAASNHLKRAKRLIFALTNV